MQQRKRGPVQAPFSIIDAPKPVTESRIGSGHPGKPIFVACVWGEQVSCQGFWVCSDLGKVTESTEVTQESDGRTLVLPCRSLQNTTGICPGSYSLWEQGGGPDALQAVSALAPEAMQLLVHRSSCVETTARGR